MSDIQRYEAVSVWSITKDDSGNYVNYDDHSAIVAQLEADLAEARKDQARYQWIRNESWAMYNYNKGKPHLVTFDSLQRPTHLAENAVDQAIDAAIKEQGK